MPISDKQGRQIRVRETVPWSLAWVDSKYKHKIVDVEEYQDGVEAIKRYYYVVDDTPYDGVSEPQYIVMYRYGEEIWNEEEIFRLKYNRAITHQKRWT